MKNILVFPCGSEIGLEVYRSLKYSTHFNLIGGSSVDDHGKFLFDNYIGEIPFITGSDFIEKLKKIVALNDIDAIYPTMDVVAAIIKKNEIELKCKVVGSSKEATDVCNHKNKTYEILKNHIPVPDYVTSLNDVVDYPVFIKPDVGYGSRNQILAHDKETALSYLERQSEDKKMLFCEVLPGEEYTVDCFSDRYGHLHFCGARKRARITNGISVNTYQVSESEIEYREFAEAINDVIKPRGAWFFQLKKDKNNQPKLLEVATRLGGSSSLFRMKGVNFAALSLFDCFEGDVSVRGNDYHIELDRALSNKYKITLNHEHIYIDYDDCILLGDKVNHEIVSFLYKSLGLNKKIYLITRHAGNLSSSLKKYRILELFDEIIHITDESKKSNYISHDDSIFIDDSYAEREDVYLTHGISVFSPEMIELFL